MVGEGRADPIVAASLLTCFIVDRFCLRYSWSACHRFIRRFPLGALVQIGTWRWTVFARLRGWSGLVIRMATGTVAGFQTAPHAEMHAALWMPEGAAGEVHLVTGSGCGGRRGRLAAQRNGRRSLASAWVARGLATPPRHFRWRRGRGSGRDALGPGGGRLAADALPAYLAIAGPRLAPRGENAHPPMQELWTNAGPWAEAGCEKCAVRGVQRRRWPGGGPSAAWWHSPAVPRSRARAA